MSVKFEYIDSIYNSLSSMDVQLDPNPIEYGPGKLNRKVAEVRALLSKTEKIFMEVSHNLAKYKRDLLRTETEFSILQTNLMATDPHVRQGRSQGEREALASTRLMSEQEKINELTLSVHDLDDVMKVIKAKRTDLKDLQGRLRDQLKLCQEQIALGQRWGVKIDVNITGDTIITSDPSLRKESSELEEILVGEEINSEEEINGFLNSSLEEKSKKIDEFDLDSLFEDFGV